MHQCKTENSLGGILPSIQFRKLGPKSRGLGGFLFLLPSTVENVRRLGYSFNQHHLFSYHPAVCIQRIKINAGGKVRSI